MKYLYLIVALLVLGGCADSSTHSGEKEVGLKINIEIHDNQGPVYLNPDLGLKYAQGDTTQDTSNRSDLNPVTDIKIPVAQGAASAATGAMDAIKNTLDNSLQDAQNDNSATNPTSDIGTENITEPVEPTGKTFELEYLSKHNRLFTWLPETGTAYGPTFKLSIPECNAELMVTDSSQNLVTKGVIYFDGTHNKPEESNGVRASVFGPVGCTTGNLRMSSE